jgi:hypothetical protein
MLTPNAPTMSSPSRVCLLLTVAVFLLAGCGGSHTTPVASGQAPAVAVPVRVPAGAIATVGSTPVTTASFEHWLSIARQSEAAAGNTAIGRKQASEATVSYLVRAQWLLQESRAEGINESVLNRLGAERAAHNSPTARAGLSREDIALQARLDVISEALQSRHSDTTASVTSSQIARYYATHRSQFSNPAVRKTLIVVTHSLASALQARAALVHGESWRAVAKRWSVDSSAQIGGAFAVVAGQQSPVLERAVFTARQGQVVGPVKAPPAAGILPVTTYYLFKVAGAHPGSPQPLSQVATQIKQTLTQQLQQQAWAAFSSAYEKRWTARTLCAPGYVVAACRNYAATTPDRRKP